MDSNIEPTQPGDPVFPRRLLGRADRALCRRLANHQITPKVLARHYKCADKTIRKIIQNKYSPKDDLTKDPAVLPADWKQTLDALSREDMPSGAKRAENRNDLAAADKMNNRRNVATRANEPTNHTPFLEKFVKSVPLDPEWADVLRKSGFTEEKLRRLAGAPQARVAQFIRDSTLFKDMPEIDQFTFALAIGRLAIPLSP